MIENWCAEVRDKMDKKRHDISLEASRRWRAKNREHYNEVQREAYRRRMKDPEYRLKMSEKKREYYQRKKAEANGKLLQEA